MLGLFKIGNVKTNVTLAAFVVCRTIPREVQLRVSQLIPGTAAGLGIGRFSNFLQTKNVP